MTKTNSTGLTVFKIGLGYFPVKNRAGEKLAEDWEFDIGSDDEPECYPSAYSVKERIGGVMGRSLANQIVQILEKHKNPDTEEAEVAFTVEVCILEENKHGGKEPED